MTTKRYAMAYAGHEYQADTLTELVDVLIPGYSDIPEAFPPDDLPAKSFEAREMLAEETVQSLRDIYLVYAAVEAGIDYAELDSDEIARLVAGDDLEYAADLSLEVRTDPAFPVLVGAAWDHPVPVVAVTTAFLNADGTFLPPPTGNVVLIDPYSESSLIRSMEQAGLLSFGELPPDESAAIDDDPGEEIV